MDMQPNQRIGTFGEELVGLEFNPSKRPDVDKAKRLCSDHADLVNDSFRLPGGGYNPAVRDIIYTTAIGAFLTAQMLVVKLLTFRR